MVGRFFDLLTSAMSAGRRGLLTPCGTRNGPLVWIHSPAWRQRNRKKSRCDDSPKSPQQNTGAKSPKQSPNGSLRDCHYANALTVSGSPKGLCETCCAQRERRDARPGHAASRPRTSPRRETLFRHVATDRAEQRARLHRQHRLEALCGVAGTDRPVCVCCKERRLWSLTFDHVHGGGNRERREAGNVATIRLVRDYYKQTGQWPTETFQVLCATCNHGRRVSGDGRCPHELEERGYGMSSQETKAIAGTLVRVFLAAVLAQFIAGGSDVFAVDGDGLRSIVSAGVAAVAVAAFNFVNPKDTRYGIGK